MEIEIDRFEGQRDAKIKVSHLTFTADKTNQGSRNGSLEHPAAELSASMTGVKGGSLQMLQIPSVGLCCRDTGSPPCTNAGNGRYWQATAAACRSTALPQSLHQSSTSRWTWQWTPCASSSLVCQALHRLPYMPLHSWCSCSLWQQALHVPHQVLALVCNPPHILHPSH